MSKFNAHFAPSRRSIIKGAGALAAGVAAPAFLRVRSAYANYPERPVKVVATGGLAILFDKNTDVFDVIEPDLTIHGLALLAAGSAK